MHASVSRIDSLRREPAQEHYFPQRAHQELSDRARLWIDLNVDLREEFTWMTKQLFLYVTVEFETPHNRFNQMVMWSHIITSKDEAALEGKDLDEFHPYVVNDQGFSLRDRPFNLTVSWNVMPLVGALRTRSKTFTGFRFPNDYTPPPSTRSRRREPSSQQAPPPNPADLAAEVEEAEVEDVVQHYDL